MKTEIVATACSLLCSNLLGDDVVSKTGPMPAHLLSMWGQNWGHLYNLLNPFPKKHIPDVTKEMKNKAWTTKKLLQQAESFFVSLGKCAQ